MSSNGSGKAVSHTPSNPAGSAARGSPIPSQMRTPSNISTVPKKTLPPRSYTVGWISALPVELAAAREMLDELHSNLPNAVERDSNLYTLGSINGHNVVLTCLPSGSNTTDTAAVVATHMIRTFPNLRFGLMVGIGGGVPSKDHDIRLGDVVVSTPKGQFGGVVQIDLGRDTPQGFKRTGMLNRPPDILLTAIADMESDHMFIQPPDIPNLLNSLRQRVPRNAEQISYDPSKDKLYEASYDHPLHMETCDECDERKVIWRPGRSRNDPVVHYGLIASANHVKENAVNRDGLRDELGVLCFETAGAGLMNHFPCAVIRGIGTYADSHKYERWQIYAATVAAAYAKVLLGRIWPEAV